MQLKHIPLLLAFFVRWFCYEIVLLAGLGMATIIFRAIGNDHVLSYHFLNNVFLITLSFLLISLFAVKLRGQITITLELLIQLILAFGCAMLVNFQTVLTLSVILATTFLYECHPFYLRRWEATFALKYALDMTAIFLLGLFLIWKCAAPYSFMFFIIFYLFLVCIRKSTATIRRHLRRRNPENAVNSEPKK